MAEQSITVKLPFQLNDSGNIANITDVLDNAKQKMRMVLLTNPGEKLMDPEFGVGLTRYLFQNKYYFEYDGTSDPINASKYTDLIAQLKSSIVARIQKYVSEVTISNVQITNEDNKIYVRIDYVLSDFIEDSYELTINI